MTTRDERFDRYVKALIECSAATSRFLDSVRRVINMAKFANALQDTPVTCKCAVILFAKHDSRERPGTLADVLETRTDRPGGWAR